MYFIYNDKTKIASYLSVVFKLFYLWPLSDLFSIFNENHYFVLDTENSSVLSTELKLCLAIVVPFMVLMLCLSVILILCRWRHNRKMAELVARERFLPVHGELRGEHVGDSTLLVSDGEQILYQGIKAEMVD